jgi:hypothetical protein
MTTPIQAVYIISDTFWDGIFRLLIPLYDFTLPEFESLCMACML